ncbi:MAG: hypothetical protein HYS13_22300 [Planctomycetia bacterium]|nr:hypothetical protein [Planctomycetia bacterium]
MGSSLFDPDNPHPFRMMAPPPPKDDPRQPFVGPTPPSVTIAVLAVSINVLLTIGAFVWQIVTAADAHEVQSGGGGVLLRSLVGILVVVGLIRGHRLAWQWGRVLAILGVLLLGIAAAVAAATNFAAGARALLFADVAVSGALLLTTFFALGRPSARRYFRLVCPQCGRATGSAADFWFRLAQCRQCRIRW